MDAANSELACGLVSTSYIQQGAQALQRRYRLVKALLSQRKLPVEGWDDATIELFINVCGPPSIATSQGLAAACSEQ